MVKVGNKSMNRKNKFSTHPAKQLKNKLRKMAKHFKKNPNDMQTGNKL